MHGKNSAMQNEDGSKKVRRPGVELGWPEPSLDALAI